MPRALAATGAAAAGAGAAAFLDCELLRPGLGTIGGAALPSTVGVGGAFSLGCSTCTAAAASGDNGNKIGST